MHEKEYAINSQITKKPLLSYLIKYSNCTILMKRACSSEALIEWEEPVVPLITPSACLINRLKRKKGQKEEEDKEKELN